MIFEIFVHNVKENRSGRELESALIALFLTSASFTVTTLTVIDHRFIVLVSSITGARERGCEKLSTRRRRNVRMARSAYHSTCKAARWQIARELLGNWNTDYVIAGTLVD